MLRNRTKSRDMICSSCRRVIAAGEWYRFVIDRVTTLRKRYCDDDACSGSEPKPKPERKVLLEPLVPEPEPEPAKPAIPRRTLNL